MDPDKEGQELAQRLRTSGPSENSSATGDLVVTTREGKSQAFPLKSSISRQDGQWQTRYEATLPDGTAETLTILSAAGKSNSYSLQPRRAEGPLDLTQKFAGTDFSLMDLGLEFLHWPVQKAVRSEMSRSQPCRVLESVDPRPLPNGYSRVLSWIHLETGGVLQAEAYDAQGKLWKKFSLGKFEKVDGQWELRDLRIRDVRTQRQTELRFDLSRPEK